MSELLSQGEYEMPRQGPKTDQARGLRPPVRAGKFVTDETSHDWLGRYGKTEETTRVIPHLDCTARSRRQLAIRQLTCLA